VTTELHEIGEIPSPHMTPRRMYASVIRRERYGAPSTAFRTEVVDVPPIGPDQVLVMVMAAGVNYNNVWAALGSPVDVIGQRQKNGQPEDYHIGGSDASGVVWAVGSRVRTVAAGNHVIVSSCQWDESAADIRLGADPIASTTQSVWGYESNYGSFAQFTAVYEYQCHPKPPHLSWEEAAAFLLTGATAYRQLRGWPPHTVQPGDPVLIWGGAGGLGCMAIQLAALFGGIPIAVVSSGDRAEFCLGLGAKGVIDRTEFDHWGPLPDPDHPDATARWTAGVRAFGKRIWEAVGERRGPRIVFEHPGQDTMPTSMYVCDNAGMVVICGATSGYQAQVDLRFLWMRQKRLQGSHYANLRQCRAVVHLVGTGRVDPCLSWTGRFEQTGEAHQMLCDNQQPPGNLAVLVNAPAPGMTELR